MKIWCETCNGKGMVGAIDFETFCCQECNGKCYTEPNQPTTEINLDYYHELKAKADKWDEKETPYTPTNQKIVKQNPFILYMAGNCKCGYWTDEFKKHCHKCGQKLNWESEGE